MAHSLKSDTGKACVARLAVIGECFRAIAAIVAHPKFPLIGVFATEYPRFGGVLARSLQTSALSSSRPWVTESAKETPNVPRQQLGFFGGSEMPASRHLCPALHVVAAFYVR